MSSIANCLSFVTGQGSNALVVVDRNIMKVLACHPVGEDPDVLAFDPGLKPLYVSPESGKVTIFRELARSASSLGLAGEAGLGDYAATIPTGLTPGGWLAIIGASQATSSLTKPKCGCK
jgi:DNA-binding beta-propeller fold protein YncE